MNEKTNTHQGLCKDNNTYNPSSKHASQLAEIMSTLDTGNGSVLHCFFRFSLKTPPKKVAVLTALLLFPISFILPMLVTGTNYLLFLKNFDLPFFPDWNSIFISAISTPIIGAIVVSERNAISSRLAALARSNTLKMNIDKAKKFREDWESKYKTINTLAILVSIIGIIAYMIIVWKEIHQYDDIRWNSINGVPTFAGYVWVFWQTPAAALIAFTFLVRAVSTIFLLSSLSKYVEMEIFHPDECGGLKEIGRLCFRNQIGVMVIGLNILVGCIVSSANGKLWTVLPAAVIYILFGPFAFLGPLTPFRKNMLDTRNNELNRANEWLYDKHKSVLSSLKIHDGVLEADADAIQRVSDLRDRIKKIQVWPFDASTLKKFLVAYLLPIASAIISPFITDISSYLIELTKSFFQN